MIGYDELARKQIETFYKNIRASGALTVAQSLNKSLESQRAIMQSINDNMVKPYQDIAKNLENMVPKSTLSNFAKINSDLSGIPIKQLNKLFPYKVQVNPELYKNVAEQQTAFIKKMRSWTKYFEQAQKEINQKYRSLIPTVDLLSEQGWVITPFLDMNLLFKFRNKSAEECNEFMTEYYTKDNYKQFYYEFDQLLDDFVDEDFDKGYLNQLIKIRKLVQKDFENSIVLINAAVSILEFKYIEVIGSVSTGKTMSQKGIKNYLQQHENSNQPAFDYLSFYSLLTALSQFMSYENFKVGVEKTRLTRHSVQHGRYDPARYKDTDFIKVILLIIATRFCPDIYNLD